MQHAPPTRRGVKEARSPASRAQEETPLIVKGANLRRVRQQNRDKENKKVLLSQEQTTREEKHKVCLFLRHHLQIYHCFLKNKEKKTEKKLE